jgi:hypothetical protein
VAIDAVESVFTHDGTAVVAFVPPVVVVTAELVAGPVGPDTETGDALKVLIPERNWLAPAPS